MTHAASTLVPVLLVAGARGRCAAHRRGVDRCSRRGRRRRQRTKTRCAPVLDGMNGSYNRSDFDGVRLTRVRRHAARRRLRSRAGTQSRKSDGPTQITVNSVDVTGDRRRRQRPIRRGQPRATPRRSTSTSSARAPTGRPAGITPAVRCRRASAFRGRLSACSPNSSRWRWSLRSRRCRSSRRCWCCTRRDPGRRAWPSWPAGLLAWRR